MKMEATKIEADKC